MSRSGARRRHNLPAQRGRLIGRESEVAAVRQAVLGTAGRLVTLTGAGGCGKTRLALQVAGDLVGQFTDGVWLVELASLAEPSLVGQAIATALNIAERRGGTPHESLAAALANRNVLIVLDNCEHLIDACASAVENLLNACPRVHILATSREQLRIRDEIRWPVPSLALPGSSAGADARSAYPAAVQLFVERARSLSPDFDPNPADVAHVGRICTRLDGLPLAIELAAAHVRMLGVDEIADRLDNSFQLLVGGSRTAPARQRTLKATLDWSHQLLDARQQCTFRRLALLVGTWDLGLAAAVCGDAPDRALEGLTRLVDLSLVVAEQRAGGAQCHMLEPVRQYALQRLLESGELDTIRRRHALGVLGRAAELEPSVRSVGQRRTAAWDAIVDLYPNLQVALRWSIEHGDVDTALLCASAGHFVWTRRPPSEGLGWLQQILGMPGPIKAIAAQALAYTTAGRLATQQGSYAGARTFFEQALPLARQSGDAFVVSCAIQCLAVDCVDRGAYAEGRDYLDEALALALAEEDLAQELSCRTNLLWTACLQGDYASARASSDEVIGLARTLDEDWLLGWALQGLGFAACAQGDVLQARELLEQTVPLSQHAGELYGIAWTHEGLGHVASAEGTYDEAAEHFRDALILRRELGDLPGIADCLDGIGGVLAGRDRNEDGVRLAAGAEALRETLPLPLGPLRRDLRDRWLVPSRAKLGHAATAELWDQGRRASLDDVTTLALNALERQPGAGVKTGPLTRREQAVAALVADGLSNRQIAERLVIAERTAATHIEHILAKLEFRSRTQIGIWAVEHGLTGHRPPVVTAERVNLERT